MKKIIAALTLPLLISLTACSGGNGDGETRPDGGDMEYSVQGDDCDLEGSVVTFPYQVRGQGTYAPELQVTLNLVKPDPKDKMAPGEILTSKNSRVKTVFKGKTGGKFAGEGTIRMKVSRAKWEAGFNSCEFDVAEVVDGKVQP